MYKAFIEPDLQTAHIKITNKFNPFTGFQTPTYILKVTLYVIIFISYFMCILVALENAIL
jgi:uridine kinase